jgi:hypothetical protein
MLRTFLIIFATALAVGTGWLTNEIPAKANMRTLAQVMIGLGAFCITFFTIVRVVDDYGWWITPALTFVVVFHFGFKRLKAIDRLIDRNRPDQWLVNTLAAAGTPFAAVAPSIQTEEKMHALPPDLDGEDLDDLFADFEPESAARPRRFMDDFVIADEADAGPTDLELERLDDFIFTARHGYLIHQRTDRADCDVVTIHPGMSIADLIEVAKLHQCVKEVAA